MALTHGDILKIQTAIDAYEKKFPKKPSPSAVEALAWVSDKRGVGTEKNGQDRPEGFSRLRAKLGDAVAAVNVFKRSTTVS